MNILGQVPNDNPTVLFFGIGIGIVQELPRKAGAAKNVETFSISKKFRQRPSTEHRPDLKNLKNTPS